MIFDLCPLSLERGHILILRDSMEKKNFKQINKKNIYKVMLVVFLIGFVVSLGVIVYDFYTRWLAEKQIQQLSGNDTETEAVIEDTEVEEDVLARLGIDVPEKNLDWDLLKETNPDIYAWIYIPNTKVDYPILQSSKDDTYYLNHDINGNKNSEGSIFTEGKYNGTDFTDFNTLVYGHNMKAKTMFATLHSFEDASFFEENRYVFVYTPDKVLVYDIFAAYTFSDVHILANYSTVSDEGKQQYLEDVFGVRDMQAHYREGVEVTVNSHLLTLSTCIGGQPNNRYLVQAVLIEE